MNLWFYLSWLCIHNFVSCLVRLIFVCSFKLWNYGFFGATFPPAWLRQYGTQKSLTQDDYLILQIKAVKTTQNYNSVLSRFLGSVSFHVNRVLGSSLQSFMEISETIYNTLYITVETGIAYLSWQKTGTPNVCKSHMPHSLGRKQ